MTKRHLILPDTQCRKGDPVRHFEWVAQAINDYKPDVVIHFGDYWDFLSLFSYDGPGTLKMEGARVQDDIEAGNATMRILRDGITHKCKKILLRGNHENRQNKAINKDPRLVGTLGDHLLESPGWQVVPYYAGAPGQITVDGVVYSHFFPVPNTGKPIGGTIQNRLQKIGQSFVHGHVQGLMQGTHQFATGRTIQGIQSGSLYLHDEDFKGPANRHWRGIVVLNEVSNGIFCEMPLSVDYLCRKYEGMSVSRYLNKTFRNAKERFSLARNG